MTLTPSCASPLYDAIGSGHWHPAPATIPRSGCGGEEDRVKLTVLPLTSERGALAIGNGQTAKT
jgi:hypothetical protein